MVLTGTMAGCATANSYQTASTIGDGNFQFVVEPSLLGFTVDEGTGSTGIVDISGRFGVSDNMEIGGRLGSSGVELMSKYQFTEPGSDGPIVSIAPSIGGFAAGIGGTGAGLLNVEIPVLIGLPVGESSELVLGPKIVDTYLLATVEGVSANANILWVGSTIGYAAQVGERFKLLPEVGVIYPVYGSASASDGSETASESGSIGGGVSWQAGMGLMFGQTR